MRPSFFHHLHPPTIPGAQSRFRYTLGAGGFSVFLALVLLGTGILEMFFYVPTPDQAGASIQMLTFLVPFGAVVRNMHFWSAQLLVITACVHFLPRDLHRRVRSSATVQLSPGVNHPGHYIIFRFYWVRAKVG